MAGSKWAKSHYYALNKILNSDWLNTNLTLVDVWLAGSNGLFHFLSVQGDGRKKSESIFALDFFDMNILSPGKQLGEFSVSLEFHSELPSIFASFVVSKC